MRRENSLQDTVLTFLNSLPQCIAENTSGNASQSGRSDINGCYKGRCLKIELKRTEKDEATEQQKLYLKKWKLAGAVVGVCSSLDQVKNLIFMADIESMKFKDGMTERQKVEALERIIIVHSIIYYELNDSVISDKSFDKKARLLAKKIQQHGEKKIQKTQYGYAFYDFDGSTGFDLLGRLNKQDKKYLTHIAKLVLRLNGGQHETQKDSDKTVNKYRNDPHKRKCRSSRS